MENLTQIIITVVSVAGTAGIWQFLQARLKIKSDERRSELENNDGVQYRDDLKNRVRNLEALLAQVVMRRMNSATKYWRLTQEVSALRVKVEYLEKENDRLKSR